MTLPSAVVDLSVWKLTLPTGPSEHPTELSGATLMAASIPSTFWVDDDGAVHFRAPVTGVTTSGSGNPRCELREMLGGSLAAWSSTDGKTHTMVVDEAVLRLPNPRTDGNAAVVCGQIHDAKNDISVFRVEQGKVWVTKGNDTHFAVADSAYTLGTRFRAMFVVTNGIVSAYYNGKLVVSFPLKGSGWYFRAGAYVQANAGNSKPADVTNYGETAIWSVQVAHGAAIPVDPAPPVVTPPAPDPAPGPADGLIVVQILRHGEKPADATSHVLSPKGEQRAAALPSLFTTPRVDLYRPTWMFASKGATDSQRMVQTATPTAQALGITLDTSLDSESAVKATAKLLADKAKAGEVVLAVLEHSAIAAVSAELVKQLGGTWHGSPRKDWPDTDFSTIEKFVGDAKAKTFTYSEVDEGVLPGDPGYTAAPPPDSTGSDPAPVPPVTDPPPVQDPPVDIPPVVDPPADPPATEPPVTDPPVDTPPAQDPEQQPAAPAWWTAFIAWLKKLFAAT